MLSPSSAEIIARLSEAERAMLAERIARIERALDRRSKADADLIDGLRRILQSPNPQAQRLRQLLKEIATNG
jgi:hypothetical protein